MKPLVSETFRLPCLHRWQYLVDVVTKNVCWRRCTLCGEEQSVASRPAGAPPSA